MEELEKLGATHIFIEPLIYWDSAVLEINARSKRLETDEEYTKRIDREYELAGIQRQKELDKRQAELDIMERIKAKYGIK